MAQRSDGRTPSWMAFILGGLAAVVVIAGWLMYNAARPAAPKAFSLNLSLPEAPPLPETPKLPPPPIPVPK